MKDYLEIPLKDLKAIEYTNPNRVPDELEYDFIKNISINTGFFLAKIHLLRAEKTKYSRNFNHFKFEYEDKVYILENGKIKEDND